MGGSLTGLPWSYTAVAGEVEAAHLSSLHNLCFATVLLAWGKLAQTGRRFVVAVCVRKKQCDRVIW